MIANIILKIIKSISCINKYNNNYDLQILTYTFNNTVLYFNILYTQVLLLWLIITDNYFILPIIIIIICLYIFFIQLRYNTYLIIYYKFNIMI